MSDIELLQRLKTMIDLQCKEPEPYRTNLIKLAAERIASLSTELAELRKFLGKEKEIN